jgi:hypothetical protein
MLDESADGPREVLSPWPGAVESFAAQRPDWIDGDGGACRGPIRKEERDQRSSIFLPYAAGRCWRWYVSRHSPM